MDEVKLKRYNEKIIRESMHDILHDINVSGAEADALLDVLIASDSFGVHTHGLTVFPAHVDRIKQGGYQLGTEPVVEKNFPAFMTVDAKNTIGMYSAIFCMEAAISKAKQSGIYVVFCKNGNTYGPAFYYTKMATDHRMIGITFCNSPSAMAPWGGYDKILGTNPLAIGIPGEKEGPVLFDMATSVVAKSKINEARKRGEKIPEGWALDLYGNTTTDPVEAIKGLVLPMAGPKGYGLSMVIDMIAGMLSGAAYQNDVGRFYSNDNKSMNVGQVFIVIDPEQVLSADFYEMVDEYLYVLHHSRSKEGHEVLFPGERKLREYRKSQTEGIALSNDTIDALNKIRMNTKKYSL